LRRREPDAERPYRALGYPVLPALYLATSAVVIALATVDALGKESLVERTFPLIGVAIMVMALVGHLAWNQLRSSDSAERRVPET
jgi:hypothetical protein